MTPTAYDAGEVRDFLRKYQGRAEAAAAEAEEAATGELCVKPLPWYPEVGMRQILLAPKTQLNRAQ